MRRRNANTSAMAIAFEKAGYVAPPKAVPPKKTRRRKKHHIARGTDDELRNDAGQDSDGTGKE